MHVFQNATKLSRSVAIAVVIAIAAPLKASGTPLEIPAGVGPLPDLQGGAKVGALVTKGHIDKYRALIPPELAELVDQNEFAFEAVLRPRSSDLLERAHIPATAKYAVDDKGVLSPMPVGVGGSFFPDSTVDGAIVEPTSLSYKVLWNTTVPHWRLKSFSANTSLLTFNAGTDEGKRVDFSLSRLYPQALGQSPGTLKPLFREKISAMNPHALHGLTWLTLRFLGGVGDYMWAASPVTGQVRQMTGSNRADSMFAGAFSPDDLFVWAGKVEGVEPSSISLVKMLIPVVEGTTTTHATNNEICSSADFSKTAPIELNLASRRFADLPAWVPTNIFLTLRSVWRIEVMTRDPFSLDARQTLYVDADTSLPVYRVVWEQDGRMKKFVMGILGRVATREGTGPGWRGEVIFSPASATRSVLMLQSLETCPQLIPGKNLIDFDPSTIGTKSDKRVANKARESPEPEVAAEPVDE